MDRCHDWYRVEELFKGRHFEQEIVILPSLDAPDPVCIMSLIWMMMMMV
jgi:hypothetical protein